MAKKIELDEKTKIMAGGIVIALAVVAVGYFKTSSSMNKITKLRAKISEEKHRLVLRKDLKRLNDIKGSYQKLLYETSDAAVIRRRISDLARAQGVDIISILPQEGEAFDGYKKTSLKMLLRCSYYSLVEFVKTLEQFPTLIKLDEISMVKGSEDYTGKEMASKEPIQGEFSLIVSAYSLGSS